MGAQSATATPEERLARLAGRAWGVVTRDEALRAGLTRRQIQRRVEKGLLIREYPGVYRVGHTSASAEARYMAAVKACGPGSVLMGRAAAYLLGLIKGSPPSPAVLTPTRRRVTGILTRQSRHIDARDVTVLNRIPITNVPRTLCDIAAGLSLRDLARACHEAGVKYRTTPRHVEEVLRRRPNTPGAAKLRLIMSGGEPVRLSFLEDAFLALLKREGLPLPITNRPVGTKRVDCRWPEHKLTVEIDSYRFHNSRHSWEQDRKREREARKREDEFTRYTYGDVLEDPRDMLAELHGLLRG
jgi:very-short-patch-repair endonuclease